MIQKIQLGSVLLGGNMSKSKLPNCINLIFVIAIASVLFSCKSQSVNLETLDPNLYDQSWLTGKPCGAPCWYGLEPGVSSRQDSITKAKQLPFINGDQEMLPPSNAAWIDQVSFLCKKPQDDSCLMMTFKKGILDTLYIEPNYQITFEQAVEKLGAPDGFSVQPAYPEAGGCELQVVWKNKRLVLWKQDSIKGIFSFGQDLCEQVHHGELPKGILIQNIQIMLPSDIESIMHDGFQPWKGFAN
jgi:hypothetical protein